MSIRVMSAVFDATGLTANQKLVALALADHCHDDGTEARPGNAKIVRKTGLSRATVQRTIKSLADMGVLTLQRPATNREPPWYKFTLTEQGQLVGAGGITLTPPNNQGSNGDTSRGITDDVLGYQGDTQTINESSIEPSLVLVEISTDCGFDKFWATYPRKVHKQTARDSYDRAVRRGAKPRDLAAASVNYGREKANEQAQEPNKSIARFTKHPATFLNEGLWRDYLEPEPDTFNAKLRRTGISAVEATEKMVEANRVMSLQRAPMPESLRAIARRKRSPQ